jgi:FtsZ-binding cell division protein ZapB
MSEEQQHNLQVLAKIFRVSSKKDVKDFIEENPGYDNSLWEYLAQVRYFMNDQDRELYNISGFHLYDIANFDFGVGCGCIYLDDQTVEKFNKHLTNLEADLVKEEHEYALFKEKHEYALEIIEDGAVDISIDGDGVKTGEFVINPENAPCLPNQGESYEDKRKDTVETSVKENIPQSIANIGELNKYDQEKVEKCLSELSELDGSVIEKIDNDIINKAITKVDFIVGQYKMDESYNSSEYKRLVEYLDHTVGEDFCINYEGYGFESVDDVKKNLTQGEIADVVEGQVEYVLDTFNEVKRGEREIDDMPDILQDFYKEYYQFLGDSDCGIIKERLEIDVNNELKDRGLCASDRRIELLVEENGNLKSENQRLMSDKMDIQSNFKEVIKENKSLKSENQELKDQLQELQGTKKNEVEAE